MRTTRADLAQVVLECVDRALHLLLGALLDVSHSHFLTSEPSKRNEPAGTPIGGLWPAFDSLV
jgi:hypothetical protein